MKVLVSAPDVSFPRSILPADFSIDDSPASRGGALPRGRGRGQGQAFGSPGFAANASAGRGRGGGSGRGTPRGKGRGPSRGLGVNSNMPLAKLLALDRPYLRPIAFVPAQITPILFEEEDEIIEAMVEDADGKQSIPFGLNKGPFLIILFLAYLHVCSCCRSCTHSRPRLQGFPSC